MKLETVNTHEYYAAYARQLGLPCVFVTFHTDGALEQRERLGPVFPGIDVMKAMLYGACCISFRNNRSATAWTNKHDEADWPFYAVCYNADGECLTENT